MISVRARKPRSVSDCGVPESHKSHESSSIARRRRRKSNIRQARLAVYPPVMHLATTSMSAVNMMYTPYVAPVYSVTSNTMLFSLPPYSVEVPFQFRIELKSGQTLKLMSNGLVQRISFVLNSTPYPDACLPTDVTGSIVNGDNYIVFSTLNFTAPVFLQLALGMDINAMVKQIVEQREPATSVGVDLFASQVCPISKKQIEFAGRGASCKHSQCFDLCAFLENAVRTNNWMCPVCGVALTYEDLRYDAEYASVHRSETDNFQASIDEAMDFDVLFMDRDF